MDNELPANAADREDASGAPVPSTMRVLLLDDDPANLLLRSAVLRQNGYETLPASSVEEAEEIFNDVDVAVLDDHLGQGKFGPAIAEKLRQHRPDVPIVILSAVPARSFGGADNVHQLKGSISVDDLLVTLRAIEAKRRGEPVVTDARDFYYSRIAMAIGADILVQIFDAEGTWHYVNESAAAYLGKPKEWFPGRNFFTEMGESMRDWREVLHNVCLTRETYIDRTRRGLLLHRPSLDSATWSVIAFPVMLHDGKAGVVLSSRVLD